MSVACQTVTDDHSRLDRLESTLRVCYHQSLFLVNQRTKRLMRGDSGRRWLRQTSSSFPDGFSEERRNTHLRIPIWLVTIVSVSATPRYVVLLQKFACSWLKRRIARGHEESQQDLRQGSQAILCLEMRYAFEPCATGSHNLLIHILGIYTDLQTSCCCFRSNPFFQKCFPFLLPP